MTYNLPEDLLPNETPDHVEVWYNRSERAWVVQLMTVEGYQIGASEYVGAGNGGREYAFELAAEWAAEHGVEVRRS